MDGFISALISGSVATAISAGGALLIMWRNSAVIDQRLKELDTSDIELGRELKAAAAELRTVAETMKVIVAEQNVLNKVTTNTLDAILRKLDQHADKINEHEAELQVLKSRSAA